MNTWKSLLQVKRILITGLLLMSIAAIAQSQESTKPNIILINVDDLGWMDLACQGSKFYKTPNIDRLASQGMRFTNAYAAASNCAPSRACMLTGQYAPRHGVYTVANSDRGPSERRKLIPVKNTLHISDDNLTIADLLKSAGYRTITIGKWHVSKDPLANGFDFNVAGNHIGHPVAKLGGYRAPFKYVNCVSEKDDEYLTDRLMDEAINFVEEHKDNPFFLYLPFYTVHSPLQPRKDKMQKWKDVKGEPGQKNSAYAAMIESLDDNVGRLLATLDQKNLSDNTLVVFTSDNGGVWRTSHQTPLRSGKGSYFEGGIRVPLIVRWPGQVNANSICDQPVINIDFMPTFAKIADAKIPEKKVFDGEDILPLMKDVKSNAINRDLFWHFPIYLQGTGRGKKNAEYSTHDKWFRTRPGSVVRSGKWKLHEYFEDGRIELYDLETDPGEARNLAASHESISKELHHRLVSWREEVAAPIPTDANPEFQQ